MVRNYYVENHAFKNKKTKINQQRLSKTILKHVIPIKKREQYFLWFMEVNIVKDITLRIIIAD